MTTVCKELILSRHEIKHYCVIEDSNLLHCSTGETLLQALLEELFPRVSHGRSLSQEAPVSEGLGAGPRAVT